jgi:predicted O-methyltransferase YrrM
MPTIRARIRHQIRPALTLWALLKKAFHRSRVLDAPPGLSLAAFASDVRARGRSGHNVSPDWASFRDKNLVFSTDWFSMRSATWISVLGRVQDFQSPLRVLEIGSWEGLSGSFLLYLFPSARITCVDTWEGSDEHGGRFNVRQVEDNFDSNLAKFPDQFEKMKQTSRDYFHALTNQSFDLIYIDGSHHFIDVLADAFAAHEVLASKGIIVFDDYEWSNYENPRDDPARAINIFFRQFGSHYHVLEVGYQVFLQKRR